MHGFHAWKTFGFYRQFSVHEFKFDKSVSNLPNDAFKYISKEIKNAEKLKRMKQKVSILMIAWIHLIGSVKKITN